MHGHLTGYPGRLVGGEERQRGAGAGPRGGGHQGGGAGHGARVTRFWWLPSWPSASTSPFGNLSVWC